MVGLAIFSFFLSLLGSSVGLMLGQLRLPALVLWLGSPALGAGTNLAISSVGALGAFVQHLRQRTVDLKVLLLVGIPSGLGAFFVGKVVSRMNVGWLHIAIGLVLIFSALQFFRKPSRSGDSDGKLSTRRLIVEIFIGAVLGALSGCVGLMMGTLRLSSLVGVLRLSPTVAVGTNLGVGCLTGILGALGVWSSIHIDWPLFAVVGGATVLGAVLGARISCFIPPKRLKGMLAVAVSLSGLLMIVEGVMGQR